MDPTKDKYVTRVKDVPAGKVLVNGMPIYSAKYLMEVTTKIFEAAGATEYEAACVAEHLVKSNLVGHDSHGVVVIPEYIEMIKKRRIRPGAELEVLEETPTTALIDGNWGFGQVVAKEAMEIAVKKAKANGVSAVGIRHIYHIGRLGYYSMMAAEQDMIGVVMCNSGPIMAPYGGRARVLSSNPISVAVPAGKRKPFLMDFATSVVAGNKIIVAYNRGERIPLGWMLDKNGKPTGDPSDIFDGGVLVPFGGHKGYALALLVDILGGILTGHGYTSSPEFEAGNGTFMMAIDVGRFMSIDAFKERVDALLETVKGSPRASGFQEILIPGELEFRAEAKRLKEGIYVSEKTWQSIVAVAEELGVKI